METPVLIEFQAEGTANAKFSLRHRFDMFWNQKRPVWLVQSE